MNDDDKDLVIERIIKRSLNESFNICSLGGYAGTLNEVTGDYRAGTGVAIQFADGSQYKISITKIK
jgi:hypothetical protein